MTLNPAITLSGLLDQAVLMTAQKGMQIATLINNLRDGAILQ